MFRTVPLSMIRSFFYCKHSNGICHTGLLTPCEQDQDGTGLVMLHSNGICHTGLLTACEQDQDGTGPVPSWSCCSRAKPVPSWSCCSRTKPVPSWFFSQAVSKPVWHISLLCSITKPVPSWSCSQAVSKLVWHIPSLCLQWKTPDDGQRNCPKHVEFYSKNKFEKLLHLVGLL